MAAIIDGTTYKGYWKITPTDGEPDVFSLFPKSGNMYVTILSANEGSIKAEGDIDYQFDENAIGGNGEELDTAAKIAQYLSDYR